MAGKRKPPKKTAFLELRGTQWIIVGPDKETDAGRNRRYAESLMRDLYPK